MKNIFLSNKEVEKVLGPVLLISIIASFIGGGISGAIGGFLLLRGYDNDSTSFMEKFTSFEPSRDDGKEVGKDEEADYQPKGTEEKTVIEVVKEVSPSVVSVIVTKDLPVLEQFYVDPFEGFESPFGDDFFSPFQIPQYRQKGTEKKEVGGGTGFIVSSDGLVVTNKHVVLDAAAEYTILTNGGEKYPARVLARDPVQDIAVLKIDKTGLPPVRIGNSDSIETGQSVIAIGNALGEFRNTVSVGVISGLRRTITAGGGGVSETIDEVIQTDAAINPGNSGGPLLNLRGEVIGINTAVAVGAENIGFAIPISKAKKDIEQVTSRGKITYPFLGVRYVLVNVQIREANKLSVDYGALVLRGGKPEELAVAPGSAADKAGIRENDIILEVNGIRVNQENPLSRLIQRYAPGEQIMLKILSQGNEKNVAVILGEGE